MLTPEQVQRYLALEGQARGTTLHTDAAYVRARAGEEGLARVQAELERLGHPIDYGAVDEMDWYPLGLRILSLRVIQDLFGLDGEDLRAIAHEAPRRSLIMRLLVRFFVSPQAYFQHFHEVWEKHYTVGSLTVESYDEARHEVLISLQGADWYDSQCRYLEGYLERALLFLFPDRQIQVIEVECTFRGDQRHLFRGTWS